MAGTWPDGLPVHDLTLYVRLSCGHERVSRGWRGSEGERIHCDACCDALKGRGASASEWDKLHRITIEQVSLTDEAPRDWSLPGGAWTEKRLIEVLDQIAEHWPEGYVLAIAKGTPRSLNLLRADGSVPWHTTKIESNVIQ